MRDISDRYQVQSISSLTSPKRIGGYLVEAGLLTHDQINVVLNDQQATGMRFGEIIVARGWLKEQTVEWIVTKVIEPERQLPEPAAPARSNPAQFSRATSNRSVASPAEVQPAARIAHSTPAKTTAQPTVPPAVPPTVPSTEVERVAQKAIVRRDAPIAKPLPSVGPRDGDVNWVG